MSCSIESDGFCSYDCYSTAAYSTMLVSMLSLSSSLSAAISSINRSSIKDRIVDWSVVSARAVLASMNHDDSLPPNSSIRSVVVASSFPWFRFIQTMKFARTPIISGWLSHRRLLARSTIDSCSYERNLSSLLRTHCI